MNVATEGGGKAMDKNIKKKSNPRVIPQAGLGKQGCKVTIAKTRNKKDNSIT